MKENNDNVNKKRLDFGAFVDHAFWALLSISIVYATSQLKQIGQNVAELNEKMAVVLQRLADSDKRFEDMSKRIDNMEHDFRENLNK